MKPRHANGRSTRAGQSARSLARLLRPMEAAVDALLGADEASARCRRYVAEHDAPPDDRIAFARLCFAIFAQGMGFRTVERVRPELEIAFAEFDPARVACFDDAKIARLLRAPIIRNEAKIRACVENAARWVELAKGEGSYLARVAAAAVDDDAAAGWPKLASVLSSDYVRLGPFASRQVLKRWGFFTAFANPLPHRVLARLDLVEADAPAPAVQRLIGAVAQKAGRDPYAVEATLALFAGVGPCAARPRCHECPLLERCPTGATVMAPDEGEQRSDARAPTLKDSAD